MLALIAAVLAMPPSCARYAVPPSTTERPADAALVQRATGRATTGEAVGAALATRGWRIVWATPADSEPGIFFLHGPIGRMRLAQAWGGPTSDRAGAYRWAVRQAGVPAGLASCFADRLVRYGP